MNEHRLLSFLIYKTSFWHLLLWDNEFLFELPNFTSDFVISAFQFECYVGKVFSLTTGHDL